MAESGPAHRDGKIQVGDKVVQVRIHCNIKVDYHYYHFSFINFMNFFSTFFQINGIDVSTAEHAKVVELLTGQDRFVRLAVERRTFDPSITPSSTLDSSGGGTGTGSPDGKSPKIFGLPRPYTGLYSSSSYMANRPSYMRNREPGQYSLSSSSPSADGSTPTSTSKSKTSTTSLGRLPGNNK